MVYFTFSLSILGHTATCQVPQLRQGIYCKLGRLSLGKAKYVIPDTIIYKKHDVNTFLECYLSPLKSNLCL